MRIIEKFLCIEGEGLWTGVPVVTIRLAGCNLKCKLCDTSYSWGKGKEVSAEELMTFVAISGLRHVSITGGEPLYRFDEEFKELRRFLSILTGSYFIKVETNGTISPCASMKDSVDFWSVSPKMGGLNNVFDVVVLKNFVKMWDPMRRNIQFKFVVDVDRLGLKTIKTIFKNSSLEMSLQATRVPIIFHPMAQVKDSLKEYRRKYVLLSEQILDDIKYWGRYDLHVMLQSHKISFGDMKGK